MLIDSFSNFLDHFPIPKAHAMIYQAGKARSGSTPYSTSTILPFGGLRTDQWLEYPMTNSYQLTQNRVLYHFQLPDDAVPLRLPASSFILIRMLDEEVNEYKYATYFPLSDTIDGEFAILGDLDPTGHDNLRKLWPNVKVGDSIEFMGPFYTDFSYRPFSFDEIIMLIGGPDQVGAMFQVYRDIYDNDNDHTRVHIIYCNKDADRTLFKEVLDFPRNAKNVKQFVITYVLDKKGGQKDFAKGFIENTHYGRLTKYKLHRLIGSRQQTVLEQGEKRKILVSGSASFMADVCGMKAEDGSQGELLGWLKDLGYKDYEVMKF
jgi:NAD(P)H-flavin reductase